MTTGEGEVAGGGIPRIHASIIAWRNDNGCQEFDARNRAPALFGVAQGSLSGDLSGKASEAEWYVAREKGAQGAF